MRAHGATIFVTRQDHRPELLEPLLADEVVEVEPGHGRRAGARAGRLTGARR